MTSQGSFDMTGNATYAASASTVVAGIALSDWGIIIGILATLGTFGVNWWYKHKTFKRG